MCQEPRDEHFNVRAQQIICYKLAIKKDRSKSLEIVMRKLQVTSTIKEDCCENIDPYLALTLNPAFCQALVLEFLSIHVLTCVSVPPLLLELCVEPSQEG